MAMAQQSGTRPRGRPPTGWTQIGVKTPPALLARLDAWRMAQPGIPPRPEAIRQLLDDALPLQQPSSASTVQPRFADGNRIRSDNYGPGVVRGPARPASSSGLFAKSAGANADKWFVSVAWDDPTWGITDVLEDALVPI